MPNYASFCKTARCFAEPRRFVTRSALLLQHFRRNRGRNSSRASSVSRAPPRASPPTSLPRLSKLPPSRPPAPAFFVFLQHTPSRPARSLLHTPTATIHPLALRFLGPCAFPRLFIFAFHPPLSRRQLRPSFVDTWGTTVVHRRGSPDQGIGRKQTRFRYSTRRWPPTRASTPRPKSDTANLQPCARTHRRCHRAAS